MALFLIVVPILLVIFIVNHYLEKRSRGVIPEGLAIPIGLILVLIWLALELKASLLEVLIYSGFGAIIGTLMQHIFVEREFEKKQLEIQRNAINEGYNRGFEAAMIINKYGEKELQFTDDGTPYVRFGAKKLGKR